MTKPIVIVHPSEPAEVVQGLATAGYTVVISRYPNHYASLGVEHEMLMAAMVALKEADLGAHRKFVHDLADRLLEKKEVDSSTKQVLVRECSPLSEPITQPCAPDVIS